VRCDLDENGAQLARFCESRLKGAFHLIGHSMGGLVILDALGRLERARIGRVVLIGTPFADSYAGRYLQSLPGGRKLLGRCMSQWLQRTRAAVACEHDIGVIAGNGGIGMGRIVARGLPKPNDGVVTVDETKVPAMRDHIVLHVSHTQMLFSREVMRQACAYLDRGEFARVPLPR
jgi:pimeloyl-ACP methyl ester carboxylesterase